MFGQNRVTMATVASPMRFSGRVQDAAPGEPFRILRLPQGVSDALSTRNQVAVRVQFAGADFLSVAWPDGEGGHYLKVTPAMAVAGDAVDVEIVRSKDWPEPDVPAEVAAALEDNPKALELWKSISAATRTDWLYWLDTAKKAETRLKRIESMCDMLAKGKKKVCCFDRSGIYGKAITCPAREE